MASSRSYYIFSLLRFCIVGVLFFAASSTRAASRPQSLAPTSTSTRTATPSKTGSKSGTPRPTTIATTRFSFDRFNLTFARNTDASDVSTGCVDMFNDNLGTFVTTAVLFRTAPPRSGQPSWTYRTARVDLLLYVKPGQTRTSISDFSLNLYKDDGSAEHNPGVRLAPPFSLAGIATTPALVTQRGNWIQIDVSAAGWPILESDAYYWVSLTPRLRITLGSTSNFNGVLWGGVDDTNAPLPAAVLNDDFVFKARQLVSARFSNDSPFVCTNSGGLAIGQDTQNWPSVASAPQRFTSYGTSNIRYGLQLLGWEATPSATPSPVPAS